MSTHSPEITIPKGIHLNQDAFIVIIKTEWNQQIVQELEHGCIRVLRENNIDYQVIEVPGAFEIPFIIKKYWESSHHPKKPSAFIALGCVLRGDTPHFEFVSKAITDGIVHLNMSLPIPTIFGVLTVDSEIQALERIGGKHGHKGEEAAITAIKMIATMESFNQ